MRDFHIEISDSTKVSGGLLWYGVVRADSEANALRLASEHFERRLPRMKLLRTDIVEVVPYVTPAIIQEATA